MQCVPSRQFHPFPDSLKVQAGTRTAPPNPRLGERLVGGLECPPPTRPPWWKADSSASEGSAWLHLSTFHSCHWTFPPFCSNLDCPHSEGLEFPRPLLLSLAVATSSCAYSSRPALRPLSQHHVFCTLPYTVLTWRKAYARANDGEAERMRELDGNSISKKCPVTAVTVLFAA